jgi:hypothetical protein
MIVLWFSGATATFCIGLRSGHFDRVVAQIRGTDSGVLTWEVQAACILAVALVWPLVAIDIVRGV